MVIPVAAVSPLTQDRFTWPALAATAVRLPGALGTEAGVPGLWQITHMLLSRPSWFDGNGTAPVRL